MDDFSKEIISFSKNLPKNFAEQLWKIFIIIRNEFFLEIFERPVENLRASFETYCAFDLEIFE